MHSSFFSSLDYFYLLLLFISCVMGFFKGFVKDFFGSCAWLASGFISATVSPYLTYYLQDNHIISNYAFSRFASIFLSSTLSLVILKMIINRCSFRIKTSMFSGIDRALGTLYGFIRGFIIMIIICVGCLMFNIFDNSNRFVLNSKITPQLINVAQCFIPKIKAIARIAPKPIRTHAQKIFEMNQLSDQKPYRINNSYNETLDDNLETQIKNATNAVTGFFNSKLLSKPKKKTKKKSVSKALMQKRAREKRY